MKTCTKCGTTKDVSDFYTNRGVPYPSCKVCHRSHQQAYREANRERVRAQDRVGYRRRTYDLAPETIEDMRRIQGGVCAICEEGPPEWVDHDHRTGLVRGLLCKPCNWALGHLRDDPGILRRALLYISYYEAVQIDQLHEVVVGRNGHNRR